ncbi:RNA-directed DNA polymerase [Acetobacter fabarum]|uniref:RNA-directed DNA polymerase n=1 Tax=Acetobacter fabarum TaxID=483199 RepID=UPI00312B4A57
MMLSPFHSFHTKRLTSRLNELQKVFSPEIMERVWKNYIRPGLRDQEIPDLHDYNDFHWNRKEIFSRLCNALYSGNYISQRSVPVRIEKKLGVTRTLVLPTVNDCLILQCIVENILPIALKKQPSKNSFFSRSHGFAQADISFERDYIWFRQWRKFSDMRLEISSSHQFVCVTDIANYFDNIDYSHLRNIISDLHSTGEVTLDILFLVLDRISWRPDYLPSSNRSLPQVNFDAPRLLSHVYLYEVDAFLKTVTNNCFVRWVDDITATTNSVSEGKCLLRDLDQMLQTRGLRLNSGKTKILSAKQARKFFYAQENKFLDKVKDDFAKLPLGGKRRKNLLIKVQREFDKFQGIEPTGQWEKVAKRYLSHFASISDNYGLKFAKSRLSSDPGLRDSILRYFSELGPRRDRFNSIATYLTGSDILDDASIMFAAKVLTDWHVTPNSVLHRDIRSLAEQLASSQYVCRNPFFLMAALWLMSKYGLRRHILQVIEQTSNIWTHSEFLARQVASTYGKFRGHKEGEAMKAMIVSLGFETACSVFVSFKNMTLGPLIKPEVRLYVLNGQNKSTYSIQRFLVCLYILTASNINPLARQKLKNDVLLYVNDPLYVRVIKSIKI